MRRRKILAGMLAIALGVTTLLEPVPLQAEAAGKPVLSVKKAVLQKGKKKTITVKNVSKSKVSSLTVTVSKKTVAKVKKLSKIKFAVTGKKKGTATITVKVKLKKAIQRKKNWKLKCKVTVKKAVQETSENREAVQTGGPEHVMETPQAASAVPAETQLPGTIIPSPEVQESEKSQKSEETPDNTVMEKTVSTQVELENTLGVILQNRKKAVLTIGQDAKKLLIPSGDYRETKLVVNAPNADIINEGTFDSIDIQAIAPDTFEEKAKGNRIVIHAAAGRVVIPKDAVLDEIVIVSDRSDFKLDVLGTVKSVVIDGTAKVSLKVSGEVDEVKVNNRAELDIQRKTGESGGTDTGENMEKAEEKAIPVILGEKADGTMVTSDMPVEVTTGAIADISLKAGAEKSSVKAVNAEKKVEVTNNTSEKVKYVTPQEEEKTVDVRTNVMYDGDGEPVITNASSGRSDTSGGTSSGYIYGGGSGVSGGGGSASGSGSSGGSSSSGGNGSSGGSSSSSGSGASGEGGSAEIGSGGGDSETGGTGTGTDSDTGNTGEASSSGNLARRVTRFIRPNAVDGGTFGESVKSLEDVEKELPKTVTAETNKSETIIFTVKKWNAPKEYKGTESPAGSYLFTAEGLEVENADMKCDVDDDMKVTVVVRIMAKGNVIYAENLPENLQKIEIEELKSACDNRYLSVTNNTVEDIILTGTINFYQNGKLQFKENCWEHLRSKNKKVFELRETEYDSYTLMVTDIEKNNDALNPYDVHGENVALEYQEENEKVLITNNGTDCIDLLHYQIIEKKDGKIIQFYDTYARDIPAGKRKNCSIENGFEADEIELLFLSMTVYPEPGDKNTPLQYSSDKIASDEQCLSIKSDNIVKNPVICILGR